MTKLNLATLRQLAKTDSSIFISLVAPMQRAGREVRQNEIRWKNMLKEAKQQILDRGRDESHTNSLLKPAADKLPNDYYWQHQLDGLAVYRSDDDCFEFLLPSSPEQRVVVADQFHLSPLLSHVNNMDCCYVLATSPNRIRLLEINGEAIEELQPEKLPENLRDALNIDDYVSALQFHSTSNGSVHGKQAAAFHGNEGSDADVKKQAELLQFFRRLDRSLSQYPGSEEMPLIFAGADYLFPIFQKASNYRNLLHDHISGNLDDTTPDDIHQLVRPILDRSTKSQQAAIIVNYQEKAFTDWASNDPHEIFLAAKMGQIETLILSDEYSDQGVFKDDDSLEITSDNQPNSFDVGNMILIEVLRNGGNAIEVDGGEMPGQSKLAAVFQSPAGKYADS